MLHPTFHHQNVIKIFSKCTVKGWDPSQHDEFASTRVGVVLQTAAIAHLSVEHLAGGEGLVTLDEVNDVVRHVVVVAPRNVGQRFVDDRRHDVHVFLEHLAAVGLESCRCVEHRDGFNAIII